MQESNFSDLINKLKVYKRKYYINLLLRGSIITTALVITTLLLVNSLEYAARFNSMVRTIIFFSFITGLCFVVYYWIITPLVKIFNNKAQISHQEAARQIGNYFPEIKDKLVNTLQLQELTGKENDLIQASIAQKTKEIVFIPFGNAINLSENRKYLKYLILPGAILLLILLFIPQLMTESSSRIIQFHRDFEPQAPFEFELQNENLKAFKNEDFVVQLKLQGQAIPENVYIHTGGLKAKLNKNKSGVFEYTFRKIQYPSTFYFEAAGFPSENHELEIILRPNLRNFNVYLQYPGYLQKENERLENLGNLRVPEGTTINWQFNTIESKRLGIKFSSNDNEIFLQIPDNQIVNYKKLAKVSEGYTLNLQNEHGNNSDRISYYIESIRDQYPSIQSDQYQDTTLFEFVILGGNISDDHGLSRLQLHYRITRNGNLVSDQDYRSINLLINTKQNSQSYYHQWEVEDFNLKQGDNLHYYMQVWDNDRVNGMKSARTSEYTFHIPAKHEIKTNLSQASDHTEEQIENSLHNAQELKQGLEDLEERLKGKKDISWQDQKLMEELIKQRESLNEDIEKLKDANKSLNQKKERFQNQNENIAEKVKQIQELMNELLDEDTKKLYEELQKLLDEQSDIENIQDLLNKLNGKEYNLEKELERTLELFKRLKFEHKLDEVIQDLNEVAEKQEDLSQETEDKNSSQEDLLDQQEELNQEFDELQQEMDKLDELNQDLKYPEPVDDTSGDEDFIEQEQQKSKESLQDNKRKKASKSQKNASDRMKQLSQKLQSMQMNMEMIQMEENLDHLRDIVDNLVKLSFDQEALMKEFRNVNQSDPRFVELGQQQLKIKDDAKIVEDSLTALANRVFQIQSFVTRELNEMNANIDASLEAIKERKKPEAASKQQFAMTSINNLAILLDDVLSQMQQQMADAMGRPNKNGRPQKHQLPGLSELQNELNRKINELKKSGKSGRTLSEELAKLAAEQERIRQALQELQQNNQGAQGKEGGLDQIIDKMEETEIDLVNKNLTNETIKRQQEIMTRLLEAEDALRERELDPEREADRPSEYEKAIPEAFEEYIKAKEREIELLKTVPVKLNPYFKQEVNEYFKRIESN